MNNVTLHSMLWDTFDIWEDYDVVYQSPTISSVRDAKYILFAEYHDRICARMHNSEIVNQTITPDSTLVVESVPALIEPKGKNLNRILRSYQISEYARQMITVIGWDIYNFSLKPKEQFFDAPLMTLEERLILLEEASGGWSSTSMHKGDGIDTFPEELRGVAKEITQEAWKVYLEEIAEDFPGRTAAMVHTLKILEEDRLEGKIKGNIYLIAGRRHLVEDVTDDSRFSLASLYDLLQHLPAIIITSKTNY